MRFPPRRELGRTGFHASCLGIGDVADRSLPFADSVAVLRRALDHGLNVIDTAPNYEDGLSEQLVGAALREHREPVFVVDKIDHLHAPIAPQLDGSLRRLQRDHVDLCVFHACSTHHDLDALLADDGGFAQLGDEVRRGRVRHRGISSHHPEVLLRALAAGVCDVVLFPIGPFADPRYERDVLPACRARGIGSIAFKTFGAGKLLGDTLGYQRPLPDRAPSAPPLPTLTVAECVHYTRTIDPDTALLGCGSTAEQDAAWHAAASFAPLPARELDTIRARATAAIAGKGDVWWNPPA